MKTVLSLLCVFFAAPGPLHATAIPPKKPVTSPERDFVEACIQAFDRSSGNGSVGVGRPICECTVKESKSQKVAISSLRKETAKIKADHKYQISDPKLLASFQYCTIETLQE